MYFPRLKLILTSSYFLIDPLHFLVPSSMKEQLFVSYLLARFNTKSFTRITYSQTHKNSMKKVLLFPLSR